MITHLDKKYLKNKYPDFAFPDCWIAGGAIRDAIIGDKPSDIDIFGTTQTVRDGFKKHYFANTKQIYKSDKVNTYDYNGFKVQVIERDYASIEACLDSFDYTICQFAFDGTQIICNPESLVHLFSRKLVVNKINPDWCVDSLRRMQKYITKGYTLCDGGLAELIHTIRHAEVEQINNGLEYYPDGTPKIIRFD